MNKKIIFFYLLSAVVMSTFLWVGVGLLYWGYITIFYGVHAVTLEMAIVAWPWIMVLMLPYSGNFLVSLVLIALAVPLIKLIATSKEKNTDITENLK